MTADQTLIEDARTEWLSGNRAAGGVLFVKAMESDPTDIAPHVALADVATLSSDFKIAEGAYRSAVELAHDDTYLLSKHASVLISLGEFDKAREQIEKAIAQNKDNSLAYFILTRIHKATEDDPIIDQLEKIKSDSRQSEGDIGYAEFALAKFYDDIGDWDKAFQCLTDANARVPVKYDHIGTRNFFSKIEQNFTSSLFAEFAGCGEPTEKPIFVLGMPRSGTSLAEELLSQYEGIEGLGELGAMTMAIEQIRPLPNGEGFPSNLTDLNQQSYRALGRYYMQRIDDYLGGKSDPAHTIDKNPMNFLRIGLINLILPQAKIIHTRRDPRDVCLSIFQQAFDPQTYPFSYNLENIGHFYGIYDRIMQMWDSVLPGVITHVDYDEMVADADGVAGNIAETLGITKKRPENDDRAIHTASAWQARQPVYSSSLNRWKNYEKHLGPLTDALQKGRVVL